MSHWQTGKLQLKCSMAVLKRALLNIMPEWEAHIREDASGKLEADNRFGHGKKSGFNLVVQLLPGSDLGFKQEADGSWTAMYDAYDLPRKVRGEGGIEGEVLQEVSAMRARAIAQINGLQIVKDSSVGNERIIEMLAPIGTEGIRA
jgi:hypothetical protein